MCLLRADIRNVPSLNLRPELIRVLESSIHTRLRTIADFWACGDEGEGRDDATGDAVMKDVKEMQERIEEGKNEKERLWRKILEIAERTSKVCFPSNRLPLRAMVIGRSKEP